MRKNEKETDDPVGLEANLKASEMGQAVRGGGEALEGHGGLGDKPLQGQDRPSRISGGVGFESKACILVWEYEDQG